MFFTKLENLVTRKKVQSSQEFDCVSTDKQQRVAFDDSVKMIEDRDRNDRIYEELILVQILIEHIDSVIA